MVLCVCCAKHIADELGPVHCGVCNQFFSRGCLGLTAEKLLSGELSRCPRCFLASAPVHAAARRQVLEGYFSSLRAETEGSEPGTHRNHKSRLNRYRRFCSALGAMPEQAMPPVGAMSTSLVVLFLDNLARGAGPERAVAGGTFDQYLSTLNVWHTARGLSPVSSWPDVACKLTGWRKALGARGANSVTPKLPFTILMLKLALSDLAKRAERAPHGGLERFRCRRDALLLTFGFFGLLRKSEVAAARCCDLGLATHHCALHIPKSKSDQLAKGHDQYFSFTTNSGVDVGHILRSYLAELRARGLDAPHAPLFPHISRGGISAGVHMPGKGEAITEVVRSALAGITTLAAAAGIHIVLDPALWASHSLRRGGLNHAMNCNISREARQVLGRWYGEDSQDAYITWDAARRVAFTAAM